MKRKSFLMGTATVLVFTMLSAPIVYAYDCEASGKLKLKVDQYHLVLKDKIPICAAITESTPGTFKIKIGPPAGSTYNVDLNEAEVREKYTSSPVTIRGKNGSSSNKIDVVVTLKEGREIGDDDEFEFWITVAGVGKLDPRVRVKNAALLVAARFNQANALVMEEFGLSIYELVRLQESE